MKLGITIPNYGIQFAGGIELLKIQRYPKIERLAVCQRSGSLATFAHNLCWAWALELRARADIDHLLIMHSDIQPCGEDWFAELFAEMEKTGCDVLGSFIPIKDARGLTSTALDTDLWRPQRITISQAHRLPITWTSPGLLVNTGLLLVDLAKPWVEQICFTVHDRIVRIEPNQFMPQIQSEDWDFSRQCHRLGARVFVTRAVPVNHFGVECWNSAQEWGAPSDLQMVAPSEPVQVTAADGSTQQVDLRT